MQGICKRLHREHVPPLTSHYPAIILVIMNLLALTLAKGQFIVSSSFAYGTRRTHVQKGRPAYQNTMPWMKYWSQTRCNGYGHVCCRILATGIPTTIAPFMLQFVRENNTARERLAQY